MAAIFISGVIMVTFLHKAMMSLWIQHIDAVLVSSLTTVIKKILMKATSESKGDHGSLFEGAQSLMSEKAWGQ